MSSIANSASLFNQIRQIRFQQILGGCVHEEKTTPQHAIAHINLLSRLDRLATEPYLLEFGLRGGLLPSEFGLKRHAFVFPPP